MRYISMYVKDLCISPSIWCDLFAAWATCAENFKFGSIPIPRSFSSLVSWSVYALPFWSCIVYWIFLLFLPICITIHLLTLNVNCHSLDHSVKVSKSDCKLAWSTSPKHWLIYWWLIWSCVADLHKESWLIWVIPAKVGWAGRSANCWLISLVYYSISTSTKGNQPAFSCTSATQGE